MNVLDLVSYSLPLVDKLHLGHTPMQIEFFKTTQQKGSEKFEYWQHLVQIKALVGSIKELSLEVEDVEVQIEDASSIWSWLKHSKGKRQVIKKKLNFKLSNLRRSVEDKENETVHHVTVVRSRYEHLIPLTEEEILAGEEQYWIQRLGRQLAYSQLAASKGVGAGDIAAIASLPKQVGMKVLEEAESIVTGNVWDVKQLEG